MNRVEQIRKQLDLASSAGQAWKSLSRNQRSVFIRLAELSHEGHRLISPEFDNFLESEKLKLYAAVEYAAELAAKFSATLSPASNQDKDIVSNVYPLQAM